MIDTNLEHLLSHNREWTELMRAQDPGFFDRLCELNVVEQVVNVAQTTAVCDAWARGQELAVHGWIYGLKDGRLRDMGLTATRQEEVAANYRNALATIGAADAGEA